MNFRIIIYTICILLLIINLLYYKSTGKFFKNGFIGVLSGEISLGAIYLLSSFLGFGIAINPFTVIISGLLGAPGVILMLIFMGMSF